MKEGKNPKMESKVKWTDPIALHRIHDEEGKKEKEFEAPRTQYFAINTQS